MYVDNMYCNFFYSDTLSKSDSNCELEDLQAVLGSNTLHMSW